MRLFGRVQGVGFRYLAAEVARRQQLSGWVRNLDSGALEAVIQGPRTRVDDMLRWCNEGPPGAYVREMRVGWDEPIEHFSTFEIRPTVAG
ncbi:MAG: acylphosphatase [Chloroflexota bacterium]